MCIRDRYEELAEMYFDKYPNLIESREEGFIWADLETVSYTHLDVYKRQDKLIGGIEVCTLVLVRIPYLHCTVIKKAII